MIKTLRTWTSIKDDWTLSSSQLKTLSKGLCNEIYEGLSSKPSSLDCINTFIGPPKDCQKGQFISIDLGGTNLRVLKVSLTPENHTYTIEKSHSQRLTETDITSSSETLFNIIATAIEGLIPKKEALPIGFTFSFPMKQTSPREGTLDRWTKGFDLEPHIDPIKELEKALRSKGLSNPVQALLNDTTATVLSGAYQYPQCDVGMILGTGTNICLTLDTSTLATPGTFAPESDIYLNLESGNYNKHLPATSYDKLLDNRSLNRTQQLQEKMVAGLYLGPLVTYILEDVIEHNKRIPELETEYLSRLIATEKDSLVALCTTLGFPKLEKKDYLIIQDVCKQVGHRSAQIAGAMISGSVQFMDPLLNETHIIGIDGSLFEHFPNYGTTIEETLQTIHGQEKAALITLKLIKDGSGLGAAIAAASIR